MYLSHGPNVSQRRLTGLEHNVITSLFEYMSTLQELQVNTTCHKIVDFDKLAVFVKCSCHVVGVLVQ